jgi:hypothetical protein
MEFDDILIDEQTEEQERQRKVELEFKQLIRDYQTTFSTVHGARVLEDLLKQCRVFHLSFTGNSNTFLYEGKRSIGLYVLTMIDRLSLDGLIELKDQFTKSKKGE